MKENGFYRQRDKIRKINWDKVAIYLLLFLATVCLVILVLKDHSDFWAMMSAIGTILMVLTTAVALIFSSKQNEEILKIMQFNNRPHIILESVECRNVHTKKEPQLRVTIKVTNDGGKGAIFEEVAVGIKYGGMSKYFFERDEKQKVNTGAYFDFDVNFDIDIKDMSENVKQNIELKITVVYRHIDDELVEKASLYGECFRICPKWIQES